MVFLILECFQVDYEGGESGLGSPGIRPEEPLPVAGIDDDYDTGTMITYGTTSPISKSNITVTADKVEDGDEEDQLSSPQLWQLPELEEDLDGPGGGLTGLATILMMHDIFSVGLQSLKNPEISIHESSFITIMPQNL